jgi:hypothetical protein
LYAHAFYENVGPEDRKLVYPSTILACLAVLVIIPIYVFYWKGPQIRMKSRFAQELEIARRERLQKSGRRSTVGAQGGLGPRDGEKRASEV